MDEKEILSAHRAEPWREELRKAKSAKERTQQPRVKMRELSPDYRVTCNEEVNQGLTVEMAVAEAGRCLDCPDPQCITGCPVGASGSVWTSVSAREAMRKQVYPQKDEKRAGGNRLSRTLCCRL